MTKTITRYIRLWHVCAKNSLIREMEYKGNFIINLLIEVLWTGVTIFALELLLYQSQTIAGWSRGEVFLIYALYRLYSSVSAILIRQNITRFSSLINSGDYDFYLIRPVNTLFFSFTRMVTFNRISELVIAILLIIYSVSITPLTWSISTILLPLIMLPLIVIIRLCFDALLVIPVFWLQKLENSHELIYSLATPARFPRKTFGRGFELFFTFIIPVMFLGAIPAEIVLGRSPVWWIGIIFLVALLMLFTLRNTFNLALKQYSSASS